MPFKHTDKQAGDLFRSADWNALGTEVVRLETDKLNRAGTETMDGPLTVRGAMTVGTGSGENTLSVRGDLSVGTQNAGATVRVLKRQEDGREPAHGALVLGTDTPTSAALRLGYSSTYSWVQGQGQQTLALNPHGGNVGVGTTSPRSRLAVGGGAAVGADYAGTAAPANGLIVQGALGVGTTSPGAPLHVNGDTIWSTRPGQRFLLHVRQNGTGEWVQLTVDDAAGEWEWAKGISLRRATGNVGIGTSSPEARLHVAGGDLRLDAGRTLVIGDNARFTADGGGNLTITAPVVTMGCYDFKMGHPDRRGTPGRALVDFKDTLVLNWDGDWPQGVTVHRRLQTPSGREWRVANNRLDITARNWIDMPGMTLTVRTTGNAVLALFKAGGVVSTGAIGHFRMMVNNGQVSYTRQDFAGGTQIRDVTLHAMLYLGAGSHDVKIQCWAEGGTLICSHHLDERSLIAVEL